MKAAAVFRPAALALATLCAGCTSINLAPDVLEGTSWRVAAVNGKPTPPSGDYSMRFEADGGLAARFGCNFLSGKYRIAGDVLTVGNLASTRMGCSEPSASFETQGAAILSHPMQVSFTGNERMGLGNDAGSIALDRMR